MFYRSTIVLLVSLLGGGCGSAPEKNTAALEPLHFPPPPDEPRFVFERTVRSSDDIDNGAGAATRLRQVLTGETTAGTAMSKPFDVSVCQGRMFVSDTVRRVVMVFDVPGRRFFEIGRDEDGLLRKPLGVATDGECNLYVADGTTRRIMIYDQDGGFRRAIGDATSFERLSHVAVDDEGERLYAVDTGSTASALHRIRVYDIASGEHLHDIGVRGREPGQLNLPRDAHVGADGRLYVVDGGNFRVQVLEVDGTPVRTIGTLGRRYGQFARPKGIATDAAGNVYVSDAAHGNFQIFDALGQLLLFVGTCSQAPGRASYMLPAGIDVDEDGRVYLVDQYYRKVDVFRPAALARTAGFLGPWP